MGEIADQIINGDMCQVCGEYFENEGSGYPRFCITCAAADEVFENYAPVSKKGTSTNESEKDS